MPYMMSPINIYGIGVSSNLYTFINIFYAGDIKYSVFL